MPPADFFLAEFPAQVDNPTITDMREVAQPKIDVLYYDSQLMNRMKVDADVLEAFHIGYACWCPTPETGIRRCFSRLIASSHKDGFTFLDG